MDKILNPKTLDEDTARNHWSHWLRTFDIFTSYCKKSLDDTAKLHLLIGSVSHEVYDAICDCKTYVDAIKNIESRYQDPKNELFNRHALITRKQLQHEKVTDYLARLQKLATLCCFQDVTASQQKSEYIRDTFVCGLLSTDIRQRILEDSNVTLDEAVNKAKTLEAATSYSQQLSSTHGACVRATVHKCAEEEEVDLTAIAVQQPNSMWVCYFCGGKERHPRTDCPAREAECRQCHKVGHFSRVCRNTKRETNAKIVSNKAILAATTNSDNIMNEIKLMKLKLNRLCPDGVQQPKLSYAAAAQRPSNFSITTNVHRAENIQRNTNNAYQRDANQQNVRVAIKCYNCLGEGHVSRQCPFPVVCVRCKKFGHIGANCDSFPNIPQRQARAPVRHLNAHEHNSEPETANVTECDENEQIILMKLSMSMTLMLLSSNNV